MGKSPQVEQIALKPNKYQLWGDAMEGCNIDHLAKQRKSELFFSSFFVIAADTSSHNNKGAKC